MKKSALQNPVASNERDAADLDLRQLWGMIRRRWLIIATAFALGVISGILYLLFLAEPEYRAKAKFAFSLDSSFAQSLGGSQFGALASLASLGGASNDYVLAQLESRDFLRDIVLSLKLTEYEEFNPTIKREGEFSAGDVLQKLGLSDPSDFSEDEIVEATIDHFKEESFAAVQERDGSFSISVTSHDPNLSAEITNLIVARFLELRLEQQAEKSQEELRYLAQELAKVQRSMEAAEAEVERFAIEANILSEGQLLSDSILLEDLREKARSEANLLSRLKNIQQRLEMETDAPDSVLNDLRDPGLALGFFVPRVPVQAQELQVLKLRLAERISQSARVLDQFRETIDRASSDARDTALDAAELRRLRQNAQIEATTFEVFVEQFKQQSVLQGYQDALGQVIERAIPPLEPSAPRKALTLVGFTMLGFIAGIGYSLVSGVFDQRLWDLATYSQKNDIMSFAVRTRGKRIRALDRQLGKKFLSRWPERDIQEFQIPVQSLMDDKSLRATVFFAQKKDVSTLAPALVLAEAAASKGQSLSILDFNPSTARRLRRALASIDSALSRFLPNKKSEAATPSLVKYDAPFKTLDALSDAILSGDVQNIIQSEKAKSDLLFLLVPSDDVSATAKAFLPLADLVILACTEGKVTEEVITRILKPSQTSYFGMLVYQKI